MTDTFPSRERAAVLPRPGPVLHAMTGVLLYLLFSAAAHAHSVAEGDKGYIQEISDSALSGRPSSACPLKHTIKRQFRR